MRFDRENDHDDSVVHQQGTAHGGLTDFTRPSGFEQLEERLTYTARLAPAQTFSININPLVAAASDLLAQVVELAGSASAEAGELHALNRRLVRYIKLFEARARQDGIENDQLLAARYVLCTVLDETVLTTPWGGEWSTMSLLSHFHQETFGGEKFFQLLERLSSNPARHLPMLELMYLCLSLGFEGKYRVMKRGHIELEGIRDGLYRQIRQLRGDVCAELSPHWHGLQTQQGSTVRTAPWWLIGLFTFVSLAAMYSGFAWVLAEQRETVLKPYRQVHSEVLTSPVVNRDMQ
ncbi:type IVB secretion system protein IcmH/DotU [Pseudomonas cichorii]|nr:type IVB secretion system protein IcmH/DotU [Pseudomonas cichorii]MBX8556890.1 type IVB secretion system protein IcmH/DotU [Pseudomonas cichorii]MBX8603252.1 type IVB secretion system protein IcmH/DotU [Pseudomonas cichorii]